MTEGRINSIHFPSIRYVALFNGRCIVGKQDCSTLCAPDLSLRHVALPRIKCSNLGEIIACTPQHNSDSGHFYGEIYASRLAKKCGMSSQSSDPILPTQYLDFEAMKCHKFIKPAATDYTYKVIFNKKSIVSGILPPPALFDY